MPTGLMPRRTGGIRCLLLVLCWLGWTVGGGGPPPRVTGAPITFNTATPVAEGDLLMRGVGARLWATDDPGPRDRELTVGVRQLVGIYGATPNLALIGSVPFLEKELELRTPVGRRSRGDAGLGDALGIVRYTVWKHNAPMRSIRFAPFLGLEAPTGEDDERDRFGRLPQPLQLGSGSWDAVVGAAFMDNRVWEGHFAAVSYRVNTEANGFEFGDVLSGNYAYQRALASWSDPGGLAALYGLVELNARWQERHERDGRDLPDSGGTTLWVTPGLQYIAKRWVLEVALQVPLAQDLHGEALEEDLRVVAGVRFNLPGSL